MKKLSKSAFLMLLLTGVSAHAALIEDESKSPLGCRDQGYRFKLNVLQIIPDISPEIAADRQSLYFLFNKSDRPVSVYQMLKSDSTRSMPLNHAINPQRWSVLATNQKELNYICAVDVTPTSRGKIVSCADTLKVCEFARVKFGLNNRGNYWFSNSTTRGGGVRDALHYGIIPR